MASNTSIKTKFSKGIDLVAQDIVNVNNIKGIDVSGTDTVTVQGKLQVTGDFAAGTDTSLIPNADGGQALGGADLRWGDVFAANTYTTDLYLINYNPSGANVQGSVFSNVIPGTADLTLGNTTTSWAHTYTGYITATANVNVNGDIVVSNATPQIYMKEGTTTNNYMMEVSSGQFKLNRVDQNLNNPVNVLYTENDGTVVFASDISVSGNLTVSGETLSIDTATLQIEDAILVLNSTLSASNPPLSTMVAGLEINRGNQSNVSIIWEETNDRWTLTGDYSIVNVTDGGSDYVLAVTNAHATYGDSVIITGNTVISDNVYFSSTSNSGLTWTRSNLNDVELFWDENDDIFKVKYANGLIDSIVTVTTDLSAYYALGVAGNNTTSKKITLTATGSDTGTDEVVLAVGQVDNKDGLSISHDGNTITLKHADTSSRGSLTAKDRTYVTALSLDTYGHVTGLSTATETVVDTDTTYSISAEDGSNEHNEIIRLSGGGTGAGKDANDDIYLAVGAVGSVYGLTIEKNNSSSITFKHADTSTLNGDYGQTGAEDGTYIKSITVDTYGHLTGVTKDDFDDRYDNYASWTAKDNDDTDYEITSGDTLQFTEGNDINVEFSEEKVLQISHVDIARTDTAATSTLTHSGTFSAITGITSNNRGHITATTTTTFTLPGDNNTTYDLSVVANSDIGHLELKDSSDTKDKVEFVNGGALLVSSYLQDDTVPTIEIAHGNTSSQDTVDNSDGSVIQDVTLDQYGHVTGLGTVNLDNRYLQNNNNYNIHNQWLREKDDNAHFKQYGNERQMVFRTDGTAQYSTGVGAYPFVWMYGGDAAANRRMILNDSGQLWVSNYGWLHEAFAAKNHVHAYVDESGDTMTGTLKLPDIQVGASGGSGYFWANSSGVVINEGGGVRNFRVESDTNQYALSIKGVAKSQVGIRKDPASGYDVDVDAELFRISSATSQRPLFILENTNDDANPSIIQFFKSTVTEADGDKIGKIEFYSRDSNNNKTEMADIQVIVDDVTNTSEDAHFELSQNNTNLYRKVLSTKDAQLHAYKQLNIFDRDTTQDGTTQTMGIMFREGDDDDFQSTSGIVSEDGEMSFLAGSYASSWDTSTVAIFSTTLVHFNPSNENIDFRVDGSSDNVLYVDASENRVGINKNNPQYGLDINGTFYVNQAATFAGGVTFNGAFNLAGTISNSLVPTTTDSYDLGSSSAVWRNIYTGDLHMSNINGNANDIDGTRGSWTIQEGEENLYLINRTNGKKYKFKLEEVD